MLAIAVCLPQAAHGQGAWNDPRALQLLHLVQEHRSGVQRDTTLQHYTADATGFVYFVLDLPERDEQVLVRTDQVALQIYWRAPDQVRQHITGLRQREELPVRRLHYYLDRLTMVQDNFGSSITIADGQNVDEVPHPAMPGAEAVYEYRLADSVEVRLPGLDTPIRVVELQVRPRDTSRPAIVGSLFVDSRSGALVRLAFTFTRAAYTDRRLDYINVSLENALWEGRYWLPHEQRVEIRREMPELDLPAGTIIRTRMRVHDYDFAQPVPSSLFVGRSVTMAPRQFLEAYEFDQPIDAERRIDGIAPPRDLAELQREARSYIRRQALSGLPRTRLHTGTASDLLRYNRAEGLALGLGAAFPLGPARGWASAGWAVGPQHPVLAGGALAAVGEVGVGASAHLNRRRQIGGQQASSELLNTISALVAGRDHSEPYFADGAELGLRTSPAPGWRTEAALWAERHRSATLEAEASLFGELARRPLRSVDEGSWAGASLRASHRTRPEATGFRVMRAELRSGAPLGADGAPYLRTGVGAEWHRAWEPRETQLDVRAGAGFALGRLPRQEVFLLGGPGTVPGYAVGEAVGDRMLLGQATASAELWRPWLRGRFVAAAGWTDAGAASASALEGWGEEGRARALGAVGVGAGIFYDVLRVDLLRGLTSGGRWEVVVEAHPRFLHGL
jgi:hypothetical protein